jgi:hypothetical protein
VPRTRLNSLTAPKKAAKIVVDKTWGFDVICPSCGTVADDRGAGSSPRWLCADSRCPFRHGWRINPTNERSHFHRPDPETEIEIMIFVAVPYDEYGEELPEMAVPWPRPPVVLAAPDAPPA